MKRIKLVLLMIVFSLVLISCSKKNNQEVDKPVDTSEESNKEVTEESNKEVTEESDKEVAEEVKDFKYIDNGSFYINNQGEVVTKDKIEDKKIAELYTEPRCPGCINVEEVLAGRYSELIGENTLIRIFPLTFIGKDKDNPDLITYSDNLAAIYLAMAEVEPHLLTEYIGKTMNHLFATINYELEVDKQLNAFKEAYEGIGGSKWEDIEELIPDMRLISNNNIKTLINDDEMISRVPNGELRTPLLWVVGNEHTTNIHDNDKEEIAKTLKEALK